MRMQFKGLLMVGIILSGLVIFNGCSGKPGPSENQSEPVTVKANIIQVTESMVPNREMFTGTVISRDQAQVASKVMGTLTGVFVKEGQWVKAGQRLASIDTRDLQPNVDKASAGMQEIRSGLSELDKVEQEINAGLASARANYDYASTSHQRFSNLYKREAISREMYDESVRQSKMAESNVAAMEAKRSGLADKRQQYYAKQKQVQSDYQLAKVTLGYGTLVAPISGLVVKKYLDTGSMAVPGQPVFQIESADYQFQAAVKESMLSNLKIGGTVQVVLEALNQTIPSKIVEIIPSADPMSRTISIKTQLPKSELLRSGIYGKLEFQTGLSNKIMIPKTAILQRHSLEGVYVLDTANTVQYHLIKSGKEIDGQTEVLSGLEPGDRVVISELNQIKEGVRVEVLQ